MLGWFFRKFIFIVIMISAPAISGRAFYEYIKVHFLHHTQSNPFGEEVIKSMQNTHIDWLSLYENDMLFIGVAFLIITVLAYLATFIKLIAGLLFIGVLLFIGYIIQMKLG
jgi:hypothetical protein